MSTSETKVSREKSDNESLAAGLAVGTKMKLDHSQWSNPL